jgi:hypothetical protein
MKPAAVFRFTAGRARLRHPWPAQVGDRDADDVVRCLDCDRDRLAGGTRAAVPDTVDEKLHSSAATSPHGCPGPSTPSTNARATRARSARPASVMVSRTAPASAQPPFPARTDPGKFPGRRAGAHGDARSTRRRASSRDTPPARPVRGRPWKRRRCTPTATTVHTDRPCSTDARPLCVRGPRKTTVYSATRWHTPGQRRNAPLGGISSGV